MTAPNRIWLIVEQPEDAANQLVEGIVEYLHADLYAAEAARLTSERDQVVAANGLLMERLERARDLIEFLRVYAPQEGQTRARAFLAKPEGQP